MFTCLLQEDTKFLLNALLTSSMMLQALGEERSQSLLQIAKEVHCKMEAEEGFFRQVSFDICKADLVQEDG